jgi:serpin B
VCVGDSLAVARLQMVLGETQRALGFAERAIALQGKARQTLEARLGPDDPDTLTTMNNLAGAYRDAGQLDKAAPLHEQTLEKTKAKLGPDHPDTLNSMESWRGLVRSAAAWTEPRPPASAKRLSCPHRLVGGGGVVHAAWHRFRRNPMRAVAPRTVAFVALMALACRCGADAPTAPAADKAEAVQGNNAFALDLYAKLRSQEGNLFVSPASISTALAMTYAGARGPTADEMAKTLHFTLAPDRLHPALGALLHDLHGDGKSRGYRLAIANALWAQKGQPFLPPYLQLTRQCYGANLQEVDFAGATEEARRTINAWVEKQTQDKIKDLLQQGVLDSTTRLVLTNAIYFKGDWQEPFKKDQTRDAPFQLSSTEKVNVPLMNRTGEFNYLEGDNFQALELPYAGKDLSMVVLLPKKVDGLADVEKTLTAEKLASALAKLRHEEVVVSLPRFQVTSEFSLKGTLAAMGMPLAFSDKADFSGMDGKEDLFLSAVVHKAFVDVNEEGTEAAAATGVVIAWKSLPARQVFRADHPFLFLIRDRRSGSILFLGRLVKPR